MKNRIVVGVGLLFALLLPVKFSAAEEVQLHIPPLFQERPGWCWTAVGEMVFKYYGIPAIHQTDYQCGIVQSRKLCAGIPNCAGCEVSPVEEATVVNLLEQYPGLANAGKAEGIALTVQLKDGSLSEEEVKQEIDEGRPVIVGLSPRGFKVDGIRQHMALIVGYDTSSGELILTVNDPFPYEHHVFLWIGSPYVNARASEEGDGQYEVRYEAFRARLKWTKTLHRLTCTGAGCPPDTRPVANSSVGKDDRAVIQSVLEAAPRDFTTLRTGHKAVEAGIGTTWQSTEVFPGAKRCLVREKDGSIGSRWSCEFRFPDRSEADKAVVDIVSRLRDSLPQGWIGKDLDQDSETEVYTRTEKFSASKPGNNSAIQVYFIDKKQDGKVNIYLSVESQ